MLGFGKSWAVGDRFFEVYEEARAYLKTRREQLQREALIEVLHQALDISFVDCHEDLADAILAKFKITPRKP